MNRDFLTDRIHHTGVGSAFEDEARGACHHHGHAGEVALDKHVRVPGVGPVEVVRVHPVPRARLGEAGTQDAVHHRRGKPSGGGGGGSGSGGDGGVRHSHVRRVRHDGVLRHDGDDDEAGIAGAADVTGGGGGDAAGRSGDAHVEGVVAGVSAHVPIQVVGARLQHGLQASSTVDEHARVQVVRVVADAGGGAGVVGWGGGVRLRTFFYGLALLGVLVPLLGWNILVEGWNVRSI